jgi:hypothetical protein
VADNEPVAGKQGPLPTREPRVDGGSTTTVAPPTGEPWRHAFRDRVKEQLGLRGMISEYMIPVETNTFWYTLVCCELTPPGDGRRGAATPGAAAGRRRACLGFGTSRSRLVQFPSVATGAPSRQSVKVPSAPGHSAGATEPSRGGASVR